MKKLNEKRQQRAEAMKRMQEVHAKAEEENRSLSDEEKAAWEKDEKEVEALDEEIRMLEKQEEINKRMAKGNVKSPEEKLAQRFDFFKALREAPSGNFTGAEAEVNSEGVREFKENNVAPNASSLILPSSFMALKKRAYAEVGTTEAAEFIKTDVSQELHIVKTPILMTKLGVTIWDDLKGNLKLPNQAQLNATFVTEKSAVDTMGVAPGGDTLSPRRVGGGDSFSKELLAQTSPAVQNDLLADFGAAIWRAIQKDLFQAVAAGATVLANRATTDTTAALTHADLLALEAAIETEGEMFAYLMSPGQRALLKALVIGGAGSGKFAWEKDEVNSYNAYASSSIVTNGGQSNANFDVTFGNFKSAVVGLWGGIEMIVDPYTKAKEGEYVITANGLADTGVKNAKSFAAIRNANA